MSDSFGGSLFSCICVVVPQGQAYILQRFGKFVGELHAGCHFVTPCIEEIAYVRGLREDQGAVPKQHAITKDNVQVGVDGTIFIKITNVKASCYNVDQPLNSILNLAQSIMRKEVGSMALDELMHNRASLNSAICMGMAGLEESWGIKVTRYEVQNIEVDKSTEESMAKQSAAERNRRAMVLTSEGERTSAVNKSEGQRASAINNSEGERQAMINTAEGRAKQIVLEADARAKAIELAAEAQKAALSQYVQAGLSPAEASRLTIALRYVELLPAVLQGTSKVVVSANVSDASHPIVNAAGALQYGSMGSTPARS